jgi:archaellum component FlaG (FlaF/FlaG flagellin family)
MSDTVNAVVNNLADRCGDMAEAIGPVFEIASDISQTVVQETANSGFAYTIVGLGLCCLAAICLATIILIMRLVTNNEARNTLIAILVVGTILCAAVGFTVTMVNLSDWIAPTKQVFREVVSQIQN